jgi:hypothetical protein
MPDGLPLTVLPQTLAVCRFDAAAPIPVWLEGVRGFVSMTRTDDELSVVAPQERVPAGLQCERDYRAIKVRGPLPLNLIGIFASLATPLAEAGLSIFPVATYDTDYMLLKARDLGRAIDVLRSAGHTVSETQLQ